MNKCKSKLPLKFFGTVKWTYILQRGDGGALSSVVRVPVHVQDLLPLHRHDPRQDAFLWETQIPHTALYTHTISWTQTEQHCVYKQGYSTSEQVRGKERKHNDTSGLQFTNARMCENCVQSEDCFVSLQEMIKPNTADPIKSFAVAAKHTHVCLVIVPALGILKQISESQISAEKCEKETVKAVYGTALLTLLHSIRSIQK